MRAARPEEYPAIHTVIEDAFLEWSVREGESYADFVAGTLERPGFAPWNIRVAADLAGQVVGAAVVVMVGSPASETYVDRRAVRADQRNRGIAQALLAGAFSVGREHGGRRAALSTDSRTGALTLYQKVGMQIEDVWVNLAIGLDGTAPRDTGLQSVHERAQRATARAGECRDPTKEGDGMSERHMRTSGRDARTALVIVDVQNDFCEGGSLAVTGGAAVAAGIARHVADHTEAYAAIVATADWHRDPGAHWSDHPDFIESWPVHCKAGTSGAEFHPDVITAIGRCDAVFRKGELSAAYSGFEGTTQEGDRELGLAEWLHTHGIDQVDVVGIATDYCVRATALDAVHAGLQTRVLLPLTAGVAADSTERAVSELVAAGATVTGSA